MSHRPINMAYHEPIYHYWRPEEKSFVIYRCYQRRVLKSEEVASLLAKDRINTWSYWGFPLATFFGITKSGILNRYAYTYQIQTMIQSNS